MTLQLYMYKTINQHWLLDLGKETDHSGAILIEAQVFQRFLVRLNQIERGIKLSVHLFISCRDRW